MLVQTQVQPDATRVSRPPTRTRKPAPRWWLTVILVGVALSAVIGTFFLVGLSHPATPAAVITRKPAVTGTTTNAEPNANQREGRVPATAGRVPNANDRESRVTPPITRRLNANDREGRGLTDR